MIDRATLPDELAARLRADDREAPYGAAPSLAYGRHHGPPSANARPAAVLLLLYWCRDTWLLPLTRRQAHLTHHAGQVSLPGGAVEPGETTLAAACRETQEELGVDCDRVRILGQLSPVYVFNSNFVVTPWIGSLNHVPEFCVNETEVAELIELPLRILQDDSARGRMAIERGQLRFSAPTIRWQSAEIWGATRIILAQFSQLLPAVARASMATAASTSNRRISAR